MDQRPSGSELWRRSSSIDAETLDRAIAYLRERVEERINRPHADKPEPMEESEVEEMADDFRRRCVSSIALRRAAADTRLDGDHIDYLLKAAVDAIIFRAREGRVIYLEKGRRRLPRSILASVHVALLGVRGAERLTIIRELCLDFLDEEISSKALRNQIDQFEIRDAVKREAGQPMPIGTSLVE